MKNMFPGSRIDAAVAGRSDLTPATKLVLGFVAAMVRTRGYCNDNNTHMARCLGLSRKTVIRSLSALERSGLIERMTVRDLGWATRPIKLGPFYPKKTEA